jgi:hypothetical protein
MKSLRMSLTVLICLSIPSVMISDPGGGSVSGKVTFSGTLAKPKPIDLAKEPACVKMHSSMPLLPENVVHGTDNTLQN